LEALLKFPSYDSELQQFLDSTPGVSRQSLKPEDITQLRSDFFGRPIEEIISGKNLETFELTVPGYQGASLAMTVIKPKGATKALPALFHIHSGGMIAGDRFVGMEMVADWAEEFQMIATTIEYRLAPEFPDPYPIEDCYAALQYISDHSQDLGIDSSKIILVGMSAGGGLCAGVTLMARDRKGPKIFAQLLMCPMLDESNSSASSYQFQDLGLWDRGSNEVGWNSLLGNRRHGPEVSIYASPTKNQDYENLPKTFLDVGSLEVFRSEIVRFAEKIWGAGGDCELHVWANAFHGFDLSVPEANISKQALVARKQWLKRALA
jgi:acetyl esterase/lipase